MLLLDDPSARHELSRRRALRGLGWATAGSLALAACGAPAGLGGRSAISVRDQRGELVELAEPARRIVSIVIPAASMLVALDSGPGRLVGVNSSAAQAIREGILGQLYPAATALRGDVADQTFAPNVEAILALDPDLVIQWGDRGAEIIDPLRNAGLTVAGLHYGTQRDLETWIELFGVLIGRQDRARELIGRMHAGLDQVRARAAATPGGSPPKILYFYRMRGGLQVGGGNTYNDFVINLVGGVNPAAGLTGQPTVDPEQVLAWDPDVVLVGNFDAATPRDVYDVPAWRDLSAVRNRRVYKIPLGGYRWDPPCQESPLMWRWLDALVRPDTGPATGPEPGGGAGLRRAIVEEYRFLYGREIDDRQIDQILAMPTNAGAANYDRFRG